MKYYLSTVYQYRSVTLHYYSMSLVTKDISENQEVELFIFLFIGYLEPIWKQEKKYQNMFTHTVGMIDYNYKMSVLHYCMAEQHAFKKSIISIF